MLQRLGLCFRNGVNLAMLQSPTTDCCLLSSLATLVLSIGFEQQHDKYSDYLRTAKRLIGNLPRLSAHLHTLSLQGLTIQAADIS